VKLIVVGAGISGLRAAMLAQRKGASVVVIEAQGRVGGRLHSCPLPGGGFFEAGGEWLDADDARALALLRQLEIEAEPADQWPGTMIWGQDRASEDRPWPDALQATHRLDQSARQMVNNPDGADRSLANLLDEVADTPRARWYLESVWRSDEGEDTTRVCLPAWLENYTHYWDRRAGTMSTYRIAGGAQRWCERIAETAGVEVRLNAPVVGIESSAGKVSVRTPTDVLSADRVIVATPPNRYRIFGFDTLAQSCPWEMSRTIKIVWQFERPFWSGLAPSPRLRVASPLQQVWSVGRGEGDAPFALCAYVCGNDADYWRHLDDAIPISLQELTRFYPEASAYFLGGQLIDWPANPFAGGGFPFVPVGRRGALPSRRVDPRIVLAGDALGERSGCIEGALQAAEAAAEEIFRE
jgi:monoamine oxidase